MAFEIDHQLLARHLVTVFTKDREVITTDDNAPAYKEVIYGEPTVITTYPLLAVLAIDKKRVLSATRKFRLDFEIQLFIYHTKIEQLGEIQEGAHKRAEALDRYITADRKWNFIDKDDKTKDKVIHGQVSLVDHPVVFVNENNLWATSRLTLEAMSEETF
jgi:hypothetical protein